MAFDEKLAERVRTQLPATVKFTEKKMFGGLAFILNGNMCVTVSGEGGLLVRVGPDQYESLCAEPGVNTAVMRGRTMNGWLRVSAEAVRGKQQLDRWICRSVSYTENLPVKG
jgi:TfoX/Sxy family transcriptional regulator of competence genes